MDVIKMQSEACSKQDLKRFCGIDRETWTEPSPPVMYQGAQMLLIHQGKGCICINGRPYEISPDAFISILPWDMMQVVSLEAPIHCHRLRYRFVPIISLIKDQYNLDNKDADFLDALERWPVVHCAGSSLETVRRVFRDLEAELGLDSMPGRVPEATMRTVLVAAKLVELIVTIQRQILMEGADGSPLVSAEPSEEYDSKNELFRYIATHLSEKLTLGRLSSEMGLSEEEIRTQISSSVGLSLSDLLNEIRIVTSINYLLYSDLTLEEISDVLGFADASHLSKVFAARLGDKITQYRRTYTTVNQLGKIRLGRQGVDMVTYAYRHYHEPLNVKQMADHFGVTVEQVNRTFLYQVEKNFPVFLNTVRIKKACLLLTTTDKSVLDIAMEVGFNSIKTFNRQFLRLIGRTPGSFRRNHNGTVTQE